MYVACYAIVGLPKLLFHFPFYNVNHIPSSLLDTGTKFINSSMAKACSSEQKLYPINLEAQVATFPSDVTQNNNNGSY